MFVCIARLQSSTRLIGIGLMFAGLAVLGGCSTQRLVRVESSPPGAVLTHDGEAIGQTPASLKMLFSKKDDQWVAHRLRLALPDYATHEATVMPDQLPKTDAENVLRYELDRVRHVIEIPVQSTPPGALILVNGSPVQVRTPGTISVEFSRPNRQGDWNRLRIGASLPDYETQEVQLDYAQAMKQAPVQIPLSRVRWPLKLSVKCNVESAEVKLGEQPAGKTSCTVDLDFKRDSGARPWPAIPLTVRHDDYEYIEKGPSGEVTRLPAFHVALTPEEVEAHPELLITLERIRWKEIDVPVYQDTDKGFVFGRATVRSYLQDIEKEPKVKSVTRVTAYHPRELVASRISVLPDSERIVYMVPGEKADERGVARAAPLGNLWCKKALEEATLRLTDGDYLDISPGVSDDGQHIYFQSNRLNKPTLWRIGVEGRGGLTKITDSAAFDNWPDISPDGKKVAYVSRLRDGGAEHIWIANADGTLPSQIRPGKMPAWSPDGTYIAYVAPDPTTQKNKLWVMGADGAHPTQITHFPDSDELCPSWHPNGRQLVYSSNRARDEVGDNNYDIWIINVDGTGDTQLTVNGSHDLFPVVAPNGRYVYFYSYRGLRTEIWRMELPDELISSPVAQK